MYWDNGLSNFILLGTSSGFLSYTATSVTPGISYSFKVTAINDVGEGPLSDPVTIIAATVPDSPTIPTLVSQSQTEIVISWVAPADGGSPLLDFLVFSDLAAGTFTQLTPTTGSGSITTYSITSLSPGSLYALKVVAQNAVGDSTASPPLSVMAATLPGVPVTLS